MPLRGGPLLRVCVGGLSGITGGSTGLNGPPVILFNLGTDQPVAVTRANLACFLTLNGLILMPMMFIQGAIDMRAVWVGLLVLPFYAVGTIIGSALFRPDAVRVYKAAAYVLIGFAGLAGLPIWGR